MKILVTGSKGFVGRPTVELLKKSDTEVIEYDFQDGFDICNLAQLESVITAKSPDAILHLAAIASFNDAETDIRAAFEVNVIGTRNIVSVANKHSISLVYASTGSVYLPITESPPITEKFKAGGNSVYGYTKYLGESYVRDHNPHIILRYSHLYGDGKYTGGLVDNFTRRIKRGLPPRMYGGMQVNDFTYVKDVAQANYLALTAPRSVWNQTYNIGTGKETTTEEAFRILCQMTDWNGEIERGEQRVVDATSFVFDVSKAEKMLNFKAQYDFIDGLRDMLKI